MYKLSVIDKISVVLVLIGAMNYGVIGVIGKNLVTLLVANSQFFSRIIYIAICIAAINLIFLPFRCNIKSFKN